MASEEICSTTFIPRLTQYLKLVLCKEIWPTSDAAVGVIIGTRTLKCLVISDKLEGILRKKVEQDFFRENITASASHFHIKNFFQLG